MKTQDSDITNQSAILVQLKKTLRRYAFIFTGIGLALTCANVVQQMYLRSVDRGMLLSTDPGLLQRQIYLASRSNGGRAYRQESRNDPEFMSSATALMNFYDSTATLANGWFLFGNVVRARIQCPLVKHVKIFILGESRQGAWTTEGGYFRPDQFPKMMDMYRSVLPDSESCKSVWEQ